MIYQISIQNHVRPSNIDVFQNAKKSQKLVRVKFIIFDLQYDFLVMWFHETCVILILRVRYVEFPFDMLLKKVLDNSTTSASPAQEQENGRLEDVVSSRMELRTFVAQWVRSVSALRGRIPSASLSSCPCSLGSSVETTLQPSTRLENWFAFLARGSQIGILTAIHLWHLIKHLRQHDGLMRVIAIWDAPWSDNWINAFLSWVNMFISLLTLVNDVAFRFFGLLFSPGWIYLSFATSQQGFFWHLTRTSPLFQQTWFPHLLTQGMFLSPGGGCFVTSPPHSVRWTSLLDESCGRFVPSLLFGTLSVSAARRVSFILTRSLSFLILCSHSPCGCSLSVTQCRTFRDCYRTFLRCHFFVIQISTLLRVSVRPASVGCLLFAESNVASIVLCRSCFDAALILLPCMATSNCVQSDPWPSRLDPHLLTSAPSPYRHFILNAGLSEQSSLWSHALRTAMWWLCRVKATLASDLIIPVCISTSSLNTEDELITSTWSWKTSPRICVDWRAQSSNTLYFCFKNRSSASKEADKSNTRHSTIKECLVAWSVTSHLQFQDLCQQRSENEYQSHLRIHELLSSMCQNSSLQLFERSVMYLYSCGLFMSFSWSVQQLYPIGLQDLFAVCRSDTSVRSNLQSSSQYGRPIRIRPVSKLSQRRRRRLRLKNKMVSCVRPLIPKQLDVDD